VVNLLSAICRKYVGKDRNTQKDDWRIVMIEMTASMSGKIKLAREARGLSIPKLAAMIGAAPKSLYRWEGGEVKKMLPVYRDKLEEILEIKLEEA
jgi:ribosome-binding protein aMBF1 (putative translation factor)